MSKWDWGYLIWGLRWLLVGFLVPELLSEDVFGVAPWPSLSATWEHAIKTYPHEYIGPLTFGLFVFLVVHWIYGRPWWWGVLYGLLVAGVAHIMDGRL